jgi:hypothetical protein
MLAAHMDAVEASLVHTAQIPANAGHTLHRGDLLPDLPPAYR